MQPAYAYLRASTASSLDDFKLLEDDWITRLQKNDFAVVKAKYFLREMLIEFVELIKTGGDLNQGVKNLHQSGRLRLADVNFDQFKSICVFVLFAKLQIRELTRGHEVKSADFKPIVDLVKKSYQDKVETIQKMKSGKIKPYSIDAQDLLMLEDFWKESLKVIEEHESISAENDVANTEVVISNLCKNLLRRARKLID